MCLPTIQIKCKEETTCLYIRSRYRRKAQFILHILNDNDFVQYYYFNYKLSFIKCFRNFSFTIKENSLYYGSLFIRSFLLSINTVSIDDFIKTCSLCTSRMQTSLLSTKNIRAEPSSQVGSQTFGPVKSLPASMRTLKVR